MNLRGLFGAVILGTSTLVAQAQQERLRLDKLIQEALQNNPEILAAQKRYEAAQSRPAQQSSLPDPLFSPGYASNGNPWPFVGVGTWQTSHVGAMISQEFPFPGKRRLRGEIASKEAEADLQEYQLAKLAVIARLKRAYFQLNFAYAALEVFTRNRDLLRKLRARIGAAYFTGQAAQEAQVSLLETRILRMEQEKRSREAEINSLLNRPADSPLARPVSLEPPKLTQTLDEIFAYGRQNAPPLRRDQTRIERAELNVSLARREYYPDYTISAGYFNMGRMPDIYQLRIDFKLPVFFWRKQRPGVAEQVSSLNEARHNREAAGLELRYRLRDEYLKAETSSRLAKIYADTVIPQAGQALESYLAAYDAGAVDFVAVQMILMALVESELSYHEERLNFYLGLIGLEELTGLSLTD